MCVCVFGVFRGRENVNSKEKMMLQQALSEGLRVKGELCAQLIVQNENNGLSG
jgi:hypothetical protein